MPACKNYAEIQQRSQQHPHLAMQCTLGSSSITKTASHYLPRPGLLIQVLTEAEPAGRSRFPPHIQSNLGHFRPLAGRSRFPPHVHSNLGHSRTPNNGNRGRSAWTLPERRKFKYQLRENFKYFFFNNSIFFNIQRRCSQRFILGLCIFWYIIKVSTYISLVSPSPINFFVNGRIFFNSQKNNWNKTFI